MEYKQQRETFLDHVKERLIGFKLTSDGLVHKNITLSGDSPLNSFFTGFLFPVYESEVDFEYENIDHEFVSGDEAESELSNKTRRYLPPSSAGFSFYITGNNIKLRVFYDAVWYKKRPDKDDNNQKFVTQKWDKNFLTDGGREVEFTLDGSRQHKVFEGKARIDAIWRKHKSGFIITVSFSNNQKISVLRDEDFYKFKNEKTLFEVEFKCIIESGEVGVYPSKDPELLTDEEKELELRFRDLKIYAVGHGAAVDWAKNQQNQMEIYTDFMPSVEVPQVTADTEDKDKKTIALSFLFLKQCDKNDNVNSSILEFINSYESWISLQQEESLSELEEYKYAAQKIIQRLSLAKERMNDGISLLINDESARIAFSVANEAMLLQMLATDENKGKRKNHSEYKWRPFQLAFILMVLESSINEDSDHRDTLDLIWFPTGGGKTEAYLGLMAFLFIYRRLKYPSSAGGTVSIMRYTLRLLTSQQFSRAAKVISALELIRQKDEVKLGNEPFTIGLWVGSASSPNTFHQAQKLKEFKQYGKFVLNCCPWCESVFSDKNFIAQDNEFYFTCTNSKCEFGEVQKNVLPCNVVDESLYENPPSLLISTVDKFARLAWEERASAFFGENGNRPPELIIQDELHLISGALGSIVGLYEVAIDSILIAKGMRVKYVASTATIKNAEKQIKTLFARGMSIFPPPGLHYEDSYFAKTVPLGIQAGRIYVGYLAPLLSRHNCLAPLAGILLAAPNRLFKNSKGFMDSWWTQVVYHGSLKSVGNSRTQYQNKIKDYLNKFSLENLKADIDDVAPDFLTNFPIHKLDDFKKIKDFQIKEIVDYYLSPSSDRSQDFRKINIKTLSSNQSAEENAQVFDELGIANDQENVVDVALATNMISVGLDVDRLALMVINGQPQTTAEYIQASSRVGRAEVPGLVFVNYHKTQARSLSHYENFRSFHDSFYRYVEPSSITPFTYQARVRAMHAALVIAIRHSGISLLFNDRAGEFEEDSSGVKKVIRELKKRSSFALNGDENLVLKVHDHIDKLVSEWMEEVKYCKKNKIKLVYNSKDKGYANLLCGFGDEDGKWETLNSMRNVENSALIRLR
jgi:hypothetical protein